MSNPWDHTYVIGVSDELGLMWQPVYRVTEEAWPDCLGFITAELERNGSIRRVAANDGWWSVRRSSDDLA